MLQMELSRVDYNLVGLTSRKCMKILPLSSNSDGSQKVVIGDQDGIIQIFNMRKGDLQQVLKSPPGPPIGCIELGGAFGNPRDKIFAACGNEVKGYTKKGKQFLGFNTDITHTIKSMFIEGSDLLICGANNLYHFQDCKEADSYLCADAVIDVVALDRVKTAKLVVVMACEDKMLRVKEQGSSMQTVPLESMPSVLHLVEGDNFVLYGTTDGGVGQLEYKRSEVKTTWIVEPAQGGSEITAICCHDLLGSGYSQLITGRDDGTIEVRTFATETEDLKTVFSYCCNESVTAIQAGVVGTQGYDEILVATFSGWVFGLTTEVVDKNVALSTDSQHIRLSEEAHNKVTRLRSEIEELEEKIHKEREKYQAMSVNGGEAVSAMPLIAINDKFFLCKDDASYSVSIEVQTSIDNVLIQSDVPIDLLDVQKNSAVVSFSDCDPKDGNYLLATYRCQLNTTRLELKLRTIEGQYGKVRAYVTPNIQPKCCQLREYRVKPLSLHTRIHSVDTMRPYNVLNLKGAFSLAEMHSWVEQCLPEVPAKPANEDNILTYISTFVGTMLKITYSKGEAEFASDNISTISILKDVLSKGATRSTKKRNIDITWNINESSIPHCLSLIHPKLTHQLELQRLATIVEAMAEVDLEGGLTEEYGNILHREKEILEEFQQQPAYLDRLYGMITDLYIDVFKFQGVQVKQGIPNLLDLLSAENYSYEALLQFFYS